MNVILVLLAAGDSRRFGGNKLLYHFQGKPMYRHVTDEITKLPDGLFAGKILVTQYQEIAADLRKQGYTVLENKDSALGISHSIHLALNGADGDAYCFAVCDQPYLKAESIKGLIDGFVERGKGIGCLEYAGELGNPAVFSSKYRGELMDLVGDVGGKRVMRKHMDDLYLFEVKDGKELADMDVKPE